jgi:hypothetical protein
MVEQLKEMMRELLADDEFYDLLAQGMKKMHDALVRAGFSSEDATRIVSSQGSGISAK